MNEATRPRHQCPVCKMMIAGHKQRGLYLGVCLDCQNKIIDRRRKEIEAETQKLKARQELLRQEREELEEKENANKLIELLKEIVR
jgi:ribosomal protein L37AE/L43A